MAKFINYENLKLNTNEIGNFKAFVDFQTDAIFWSNGEVNIFASPEWDECEGQICVQIYDGDTRISDGYEFKLENPFDLEKQEAQYIDLVTRIIEAIERDGSKDFDEILQTI